MNETNYSFIDNSSYGDYAGAPSLQDWGQWVKFATTPMIVGIGIIGNALSFVVMKTKSLRHKSYSHYLCALAFFDTLTLLLRLVITVDEYYKTVLYKQGLFQEFSHGACAMFNFFEHVSYLMSSWLVVLMAVERLVAVCMPFRKALIRTQSGAIITICVLCIIVCVSQVFRVVMVENFDSQMEGINARKCAAAENYISLFSMLTVYYYEMALMFVLPVGTILTCNCLVLYQIFRVQKAIKQKDTSNKRYRKNNKRHRTTYMLLTVSFTYIFTLLPSFIVQIIIDVSIRTRGMDARHIFEALYPYTDVLSVVSLINYAVNFFIYILAGHSFRFELRKIFVKERNTSFTATRTREEFIRL